MPASHRIVREVVASVDRRRRWQSAVRVATRLAPAAAVLVFAASVLSVTRAWPLMVAGWIWIGTAAALLAALAFAARQRASTDEMAARLDADAHLDGELRSAHWFALSDTPRDEWTTFHLDRAVARTRDVAWRRVYPPARTGRALGATLALSVAAVALPFALSSSSSSATAAVGPLTSLSPRSASAPAPVMLEGLPPELRERLLAVLAAADRAGMSPDQTIAAVSKMAELTRLDPALQGQIKELLRRKLTPSAPGAVAQADTADRAPAPAGRRKSPMTDEMKWALDNFAARLANEAAQRRPPNAAAKAPDSSFHESPSTSTGPSGNQQASTNLSQPKGDQEASLDVSRQDIQTNRGANGMVIDAADATPGSPNSRGESAPITPPATPNRQQLAESLSHEVLEAHASIDNSDVDNRENRRKTEQAHSAMAYTDAVATSTFESARVTAAPAVPERRRALVERYFVRSAPPVTVGEQP